MKMILDTETLMIASGWERRDYEGDDGFDGLDER